MSSYSNSYKKGKEFAKRYYSDKSKGALIGLRQSYIKKFDYIELDGTRLYSNKTIENRKDWYCGVVDTINKLLKKM